MIQVICKWCSGSGEVSPPGTAFVRCGSCHGTGYTWNTELDIEPQPPVGRGHIVLSEEALTWRAFVRLLYELAKLYPLQHARELGRLEERVDVCAFMNASTEGARATRDRGDKYEGWAISRLPQLRYCLEQAKHVGFGDPKT